MKNTGWDRIPCHLLDFIFNKSETTKEVMQLGMVCEDWYETLKHNKNKKKNVIKEIPMLLMPDTGDPHSLCMFDICANKFLKSKLKVSYERRFCGSSRGWLFSVNNDWSVNLHKPFSNTHSVIELPPVFPPSEEFLAEVRALPMSSFPQFYPWHVRKILISGDPLENPDECIVIALLWDDEEIAIFRFAKKNSPSLSSWTKITQDAEAHDMLIINTHLYWVSCRGEIHSLDIKSPLVSKNTILCENSSPDEKRWGYLAHSTRQNKTYLVKRYVESIDGSDIFPNTINFEVFEVDLETGGLKKVTSIGDDTLFLGDNSSLCVKACPLSGCLPNCIYFTHHHDLASSQRYKVRDNGIYDITKGEFIFRYIVPRSTFCKTRRPPIFVIPTLDV